MLYYENLGDTLDKDIAERFLKKSGSRKIMTNNLIENEHGFMSWELDGDAFVCLNGFILGFFSLWFVNAVYKYITNKDGIGGGDFILFGGIGAIVGPFHLPIILLFGALVSLIIYLILLKKTVSEEIPLGTGLICGFFLYVFLSFYELLDILIVLNENRLFALMAFG